MSNAPREEELYPLAQQPPQGQSQSAGHDQSQSSYGGGYTSQQGQASGQRTPPPQEIRVVCSPRGEGIFSGCFKIVANLFSYLFMFVMFFAVLYMFRGGDSDYVHEKHFAGEKYAENKIAIITISGVIVGDEDGGFVKQLKTAEDDASVKAVVLRIDSPGGTVSGSDYYHYKLQEFKKNKGVPMVVSMGDMATSGGYYLAVTGDEIFAENATITGSIGVIMPNYDLSELCDKIGVKSDPIVSGPLKELGSVTRKMTVQERQVLEGVITDMFERFKEVVREGRPAFKANPQTLDEIATGQIYTAKQAIDNKLIDKIGYLDNAVERAAELAHLQPESYEAIRYESPKTALEAMLGANVEKTFQASAQTAVTAELINEIATPRMYYLYPRALPIKGSHAN